MSLRIRAYRNGDWPAYPWPWTAALEEWNDAEDEFDILDHGDGDTPAEAVAHLREINRRAIDALVEVAS